jgi:hypothetical protein
MTYEEVRRGTSVAIGGEHSRFEQTKQKPEEKPE